MPDRRSGLAAQIRERLNTIEDPCSVAAGTAIGLADMGLVEDVTVSREGDVRISLRLTSPTCNMLGFMAEEASARVGELAGVRTVEVVSDEGLDWTPSMMSPSAQERRRARIQMLHDRAREHRETHQRHHDQNREASTT